MQYKIICDYSENYESKTETGHVNDHQMRETFLAINDAARRLGYECEIFGGVPELLHAYNTNKQFPSDTIFINLSDGTNANYSRVQIPVLCDLIGLKYSGSGTFETALTSNKFYASLAVKTEGVLTPHSTLISHMDDFSAIKNQKSIIKPNSEGSSIGITSDSVCFNKVEIIKQVKKLLIDFPEVLIEEYISGYDVTCFVIGNEEICLNEVLVIKHHNKFLFDNEVLGYKDHLFQTRTFFPCSMVLPKQTEQLIQQISLRIKNILNIKDFCRIDFRVTPTQQIYFLEINTVPAISINSQVGVICKKLNISFDDFIDRIIKTVTNRFNHV